MRIGGARRLSCDGDSEEDGGRFELPPALGTRGAFISSHRFACARGQSAWLSKHLSSHFSSRLFLLFLFCGL